MESAILDQFGRPFASGSLENPALSLTDPKTWDAVLGGATAASGARVTTQSALGYPPLWRGVNLIAGDVGRLPLVLYQRTPDNGKQPARQHPAFRLLRRRVSPILKTSTFKKTLTFHALLHGNGYAAIFRDGRGLPRELLLLSPVETFPALSGGALWYVTTIGGEQVRLPARDVFHVKGLSHDGLVGLNVIDVMRESLGLGIGARDMGSKHFGQGMLASGILMIPGNFSDEKARNTIKAWNNMATGLTKAGRVALLQDGAKFQQLTQTAEASQFLETRQFEVREVANILGVPPHKLGDSSRTSYNSLEAENQSYLDECLDERLVEWEDEANDKLLAPAEQETDSHFCEFQRAALLKTDAATRAAVYAKQSEIGVLTINDILRRENLPTIGPIGDKRYRPSNWTEIGAENPAGARAAATNQQTRLALWNLLRDRLDRLGRIEKDKLEQAARQPAPALDGLYDQQVNRMAESLGPVLRVIDALAGRKGTRKRLDAVLDTYRQSALAAATADVAAAAAAVDGRVTELRNTLFPRNKESRHAPRRHEAA